MIYTFYSYKGGVGRSMALVNIAELMYQKGLRVLMVDWDLEAPGLERFYPTHVETVLKSRGIIDMILAYKDELLHYTPETADWLLPNLKDYVINLHPDYEGQAKLWLLPAGKRKERQFVSYSKQVKSFDWQDFYENWGGEAYFEGLRQRFEAFADVVLIDSRTGVTEMGGVCTYQLADVVVMLCSANEQSIAGTLEMVKSFTDPELPDLRYGRTLKTLIVPARIERLAETTRLNEFRTKFYEIFKPYIPPNIEAEEDFFEQLEVQYVPLYAFEELIAVNLSKSKYRSPELKQAYTNLLNVLGQLAPEDSILKEKLLSASITSLQVVSPSSEQMTTNLISLAETHQALGNLETALQYYQQALDIQQTLDDKKELATILKGMGDIYYQQTNFNTALINYKQALPIFEELKDVANEASILSNMGDIYQASKDYNEALNCYNKARSIFKHLGDKLNEVIVLKNIGIIYQIPEFDNHKLALKFYTLALGNLRHYKTLNTKMENVKAIVYKNMGEIYQISDSYIQAFRNYQQALIIFQRLGDRSNITSTRKKIEQLYEIADPPLTESLDYFKELLVLSEEQGGKAKQAATLVKLGKIYQAKGELEKALEYHQKALALNQELDNNAQSD